MKNGIILAKKSTWSSRLDLDYLDEKSELKQRQQENFIGQKLRQFSDYASKETVGQVHAAGFFHFKVGQNNDGTFTSPPQLSNEERKKRIAQVWHEHLKNHPSKGSVIQHRLVFSMSQPMHDALLKNNLNPDAVLHQSMKKVMRQFQEKFHQGDAIGYAYGFHHDTRNLHVHVALCPRTKEGRYVGCSTSRNPKVSGNRNQLDFIRNCFESENQKWENLLKSPEQLNQRVNQLCFVPKLDSQQLIQLQNSQNIQAFELQQTYQQMEHVRGIIVREKRERLNKANDNYMKRLCGIKKPLALKVVEMLAKDIHKNRLRKAQQELHRLRKIYLQQYRNYQKGNHHVSRNAYYQKQSHSQRI
ncbi:MAG: hypothetical protein R3F23_08655 [Verrucomicrobiia bacterium]